MHKIEKWTCHYGNDHFDYYIKRDLKTGKGKTLAIDKKIEKAKDFYNLHGFMDFTRFCGFLSGCGLSLADKIELYLNNF